MSNCESNTSTNCTPIKYRLPDGRPSPGSLKLVLCLYCSKRAEAETPASRTCCNGQGRVVHSVLRSGVEQRSFAHTVMPLGALPLPPSDVQQKTKSMQTTHTIRAQPHWHGLCRVRTRRSRLRAAHVFFIFIFIFHISFFSLSFFHLHFFIFICSFSFFIYFTFFYILYFFNFLVFSIFYIFLFIFDIFTFLHSLHSYILTFFTFLQFFDIFTFFHFDIF